ncbi:hypothetical protein [Burkholderia anthina]|uniref:hypothetical protein n=1 Tax=Burkholderia anthina TaxID=179879 RepID=UPI00158A02EF|nr:hypothetical protein [Burkholderia anthina]
MSTVLVPARVVELLKIINRDGVLKRATELQEVYRLIESAHPGQPEPFTLASVLEWAGVPDVCRKDSEPRAEVTLDDIAKLKRFAGLVLKDHRNGGYPGEVDGGELQAYAEQCGLIEERRVESPCGENCPCTDFGEFPTTCYFNTDLGKAVIDAARAGEHR